MTPRRFQTCWSRMQGFSLNPVLEILVTKGLGHTARIALGIGYRYPLLTENASLPGGTTVQEISH